jgi:hypothetical protein
METSMADENPAAPVAAAAPAAHVRVKCITDLQPWAYVLEADGKEVLRALGKNEIVKVSRGDAKAIEKNDHAVVISEV